MTFFNEKLEDCRNDEAQHFLCLIGHVSDGYKTSQPRSINHTTYWIKEFMRRKGWNSSARIFNLCKNFDTAVIQPLYEAVEKNDLITLRCLLVHIICDYMSNSANTVPSQSNRFQLSKFFLFALAFIPLFFIFFPWQK